MQNTYTEAAAALAAARPELKERELPLSVMAAHVRGKPLGEAMQEFEDWFRGEYTKASQAWQAARNTEEESEEALFLRGFDAVFGED